MKTNQVIIQIQHRIREYEVLFFIVIVSFALMGGCEDKKEAKEMNEIPADEVTTEVQQAPAVPVWAPADTDPAIRFYFIPEMGIYYDAFMGDYVYWNGNYWTYSPLLPHGYVYFDLFDANVVFLSAGISHPWHHHHYYVNTYPVYFFAGRNHHHGWRYYNENSRRFMGAHRNSKYNAPQNASHRKGGGNAYPRKDVFDIPKTKKNQNRHSPEGIKQPNKQEKDHRMQQNINSGKKEQPSMNKRQSNEKKNIKASEHRDINYKQRNPQTPKKQTPAGRQGGSKSGGKKSGKRD